MPTTSQTGTEPQVAEPQFALAMRLDPKRLTDETYLRRVEAGLLQNIEEGRRHQEWLQGKSLRLVHQGFSRKDDDKGPVLVCRALVKDNLPTDGGFLKNPDGTLRRWPGPGAARPAATADQ